MRGWRKTMEDAGIWEFNFDGKGRHLFAIFDGHGGGEIAIFAKRYLKDLLLRN
jgi:serine/threonine protein phosphatase PrpC